jgi:hypothetical protein
MFLLTCRLNHSCKPNVRWTYDREKERIYTRYMRLSAVPYTHALARSPLPLGTCQTDCPAPLRTLNPKP